MSDKQRVGEVPTTGGARPGPVTPSSATPKGTRSAIESVPVAIRIPSIQLDTEVERRPITDGVMADPTGPWVVAWYGATSRLGVPGNAVMSGHVDYAGVGPAVFARVKELVPDDRIEITGRDGKFFQFGVIWSRLYEAANAPMEEIVGETEDQSLTLVTCGGDFDTETQSYIHRLIVRATRQG